MQTIIFQKISRKILSAYEDKIPKKVNSLLLITLTLSYTGVFGLTGHGGGGGEGRWNPPHLYNFSSI